MSIVVAALCSILGFYLFIRYRRAKRKREQEEGGEERAQENGNSTEHPTELLDRRQEHEVDHELSATEALARAVVSYIEIQLTTFAFILNQFSIGPLITSRGLVLILDIVTLNHPTSSPIVFHSSSRGFIHFNLDEQPTINLLLPPLAFLNHHPIHRLHL